MSFLLAVLPAEAASITVSDSDTCSSCRCCVQTNTNPAPVRGAPAAAAKTVRVDRAARVEPLTSLPPTLPAATANLAVLEQSTSLGFPVALFQQHCSLLI